MPTRTALLQQNSAANFGTGVFTANAFTPANNSLLLAILSAIENNDTGLEGSALTLAGGGLTWTPQVATTVSPAWSYGIRAFTAPVATGASTQLQADAGAFNVYGYRLEVYQYTNYDTGQPVGGVGANSDSDGNGPMTVTLNAAPRSDSEVIGALVNGLSTGSATAQPGTGFTTLFTSGHDGWTMYHTMVRGGSTSDQVPWDDVLLTGSTFGGANGLAIEIRDAAAGASPTIVIPRRNLVIPRMHF